MTLLLILLYTQTINTFSAENVLSFADHLYIQEDYAAALNEYQRYQFLTDSMRSDIPARIVDCLINLQRYNEALVKCNDIEDEVQREFTKGTVFFVAQQYDSSRTHLMDIGKLYGKEANKIIGLSYAFEFRFQKAEEYLSLPPDKPTYKKPGLGALCALFPGGGIGTAADSVMEFFHFSWSAPRHFFHTTTIKKMKISNPISVWGQLYSSIRRISMAASMLYEITITIKMRNICRESLSEFRGQISRACCPNPFLSLRAPTIKNCNGRGVAISLYFMRLLRRCASRNDILEFHMPEFDLGNTPSTLNKHQPELMHQHYLNCLVQCRDFYFARSLLPASLPNPLIKSEDKLDQAIQEHSNFTLDYPIKLDNDNREISA